MKKSVKQINVYSIKSHQYRNMMKAVKNADFVLIYRSQYAVAVKYNRHTDIAPVVIAKGRDAVALKIKFLATENNIYMIHYPGLARVLYQEIEVTPQYISHYLYVGVAEVFAYIYSIQGDKYPLSYDKEYNLIDQDIMMSHFPDILSFIRHIFEESHGRVDTQRTFYFEWLAVHNSYKP